MKYVGIDLHKKTISGCVVVKERGQKKIAARKRLKCRDEAGGAWVRCSFRRGARTALARGASSARETPGASSGAKSAFREAAQR